MDLVQNSDWILTKNGILQKVKSLLENVQHQQQLIVEAYENALPAEVIAIPPKISRGENYKGLPWLVLDQPRYFEKNNHFAIRSMFWWGNFFSSTLQLSGLYRDTYMPAITRSLTRLQQDNYYLCVGDDPWEHHFEESNYRSVREMDRATLEKYVDSKDFLKLATRHSLSDWDGAENFLLTAFSNILGILSVGKE